MKEKSLLLVNKISDFEYLPNQIRLHILLPLEVARGLKHSQCETRYELHA
jgi:hypothetical protein